MELNSVVYPKTKPHQYKVELLTTQYRSIPAIGNIFSHFAYRGILKHYRTASSQRQLNIGNNIGVKTLNIIKYPVSKAFIEQSAYSTAVPIRCTLRYLSLNMFAICLGKFL